MLGAVRRALAILASFGKSYALSMRCSSRPKCSPNCSCFQMWLERPSRKGTIQ